MASLTGFTLPEIKDSDLNDEKQRRQILEYLYQLTEQLRFTLSNLDEENFSDSVSDNIQGAYTAASSASKEVKDMSGNVSRIKQFADTLTLAVENGDTSSSIALMANGVQIASEEIILKGAVTFTDLETAGRTTINGSNIKTGKVAANVIDVDNLYVKHLNGADGTFSGTLSAPDGNIGGFNITSIGIISDYVSIYSAGSTNQIKLGNPPYDGVALIELNGGLTISPSAGIVSLNADANVYGDLYVSGDFDVSGSFNPSSINASGNITGGTINSDAGIRAETYVAAGSYVNVGSMSTTDGVDYPVYWGKSSKNLLRESSSSRRYKKDIERLNIEEYDDVFSTCGAVRFHYKDREYKEGEYSYGLIAEEVHEKWPHAIVYEDTEQGRIVDGINYARLTVPLVIECQNLRRLINEVKTDIENLKKTSFKQ